MSVDCGSCFAKYLLCLFNFFFFIGGTVVLAVGIWLAADKASFIQFTKLVDEASNVDGVSQFSQPYLVEQAAYVLIAVGSFVFFISFLGYCGALRESRCLLTCYAVALILVLLLQATAIGLAVGFREDTEAFSRDVLRSSIQKHYAQPQRANGTDGVTFLWDQMMMQLQCCGVDGYADFQKAPKWTEGNNRTVPPACCVLRAGSFDTQKIQPIDPDCVFSPTEANSYFKTGCFDKLVYHVVEHQSIVIGVCVALGVVQLLGVCLAFCLCNSINQYLK